MSKRTTDVDGLSELRGSRAWTESEARRVLDAWVESGVNVNEFARRAGLVARRVYWWRERLGVAGGRKSASTAATFVPMVVRDVPSGGGGGASVWTRDGHRVEVAELNGVSAAWVATVVRSLEGRS